MPHFFIERPVFAWVVALFIVLAGLLSIPRLPVAQYPAVAPPGIIISVSYRGPARYHEHVGGIVNRARNLRRR